MEFVRRAAFAVVASLTWTACTFAGADAAQRIEQGQDFRLKLGESAATPDGQLRIGLDGIESDSRCAKGEQCIRAGDVTVRIWVQRASQAREIRELHASPGAGSVRVSDLFVRLVRVDPMPITGRVIAKADYVVTLRLHPSGAGAGAEEGER